MSGTVTVPAVSGVATFPGSYRHGWSGLHFDRVCVGPEFRDELGIQHYRGRRGHSVGVGDSTLERSGWRYLDGVCRR